MEKPSSNKKTSDTRTRILDAAEDVFNEKGYSKTTLNEIALAAGMTRGAIYWNFKNKEDLFREMCNRVREEILVLMKTDASDRGKFNPIEALMQSHESLINEIIRNPHFRKILTIILLRCEHTDETSQIHTQLMDWKNYVMGMLTEALTEAQKKKLMPVDLDIDMAVNMLYYVHWGMVRNWLLDSTKYDLETHARNQQLAIFEMFRNSPYLKKR